MSNKKYIAFEGLDGSGKDTQKNLAIKHIQDRDKYTFIWQIREPSKYTTAGRQLAELLKWDQLDPKLALKYFVRDRAGLSPLIKSYLEHSHVISSRCFLSSYLYQQTQWLSFEEIDKEHALYSDIRYPDHILFYDVDIDHLENRINHRGWDREIFEKKEFQEKNRAIALETIPKITQSPITIIDANGSIEDILQITKKIIDQILFSEK